MELTRQEKEEIQAYEEELKQKGRLTKEEIAQLIDDIDKNQYSSIRKLMEYHLYYAYEIAKTYENEELTLLDFLHAANEGLEIGVTSKEYNDYESFIKKIDESIKSAIELIVSYIDKE